MPVCISYGMGGKAIDWAASNGGGEDYLKARCNKVKINTLNSVYNWYMLQQIVDDLRKAKRANPSCKVGLVGDSLGDNELGDLCADLEGVMEIDYIGGFQGSVWGKHTYITPNCKRATIIYNPCWIATGGLGDFPLPLVTPAPVEAGGVWNDGKWRLGNNGKTWVRYVQIEAPHPDDWGVAQDLVFADLKQYVGA